MGLESLILTVPSNIEVINESIQCWAGARVTRMSVTEIRQSKSLWKNSKRWKIIDCKGSNLDTAQGYGYKEPYTAQKKIDSMNRK